MGNPIPAGRAPDGAGARENKKGYRKSNPSWVGPGRRRGKRKQERLWEIQSQLGGPRTAPGQEKTRKAIGNPIPAGWAPDGAGARENKKGYGKSNPSWAGPGRRRGKRKQERLWEIQSQLGGPRTAPGQEKTRKAMGNPIPAGWAPQWRDRKHRLNLQAS